MTEMNDRRLPVGIQSFEKIRKGGYLYVDKTDIIWQLANRNKTYNYLSRPRRFGKSVLVDTLEAYFMGKKELFEGLKIMQMEKDWTCYPVIRLDMSCGGATPEELNSYLDDAFYKLEQKYEVAVRPEASLAVRFQNIIETIFQKTGKQVVILIDEYDSPLQHSWKTPQHDACTAIYKSVFAVLKKEDEHERFVFITGITKFTQISLFSVLNNLSNISFDAPYATICGISKQEAADNFMPEIEAMGEENGWTPEETLKQLTAFYDGYHFCSDNMVDIFNPFSLLNCFANQDFGSYWFASGTPTYLINMMRKFHVLPATLGKMYAKSSAFDAPTENMTAITPLLYQSGYLTIKDYDKTSKLYTLDLPNKEIKVGLFESLLPNYLEGMFAQNGDVTIAQMSVLIRQDDMDGALQLLQTFLGTVPYCNVTNHEGHYQQMLFIIFSLLTGYVVDVEVHTPNGRVDIVLLTDIRLYIIELKLNRDAQTALQQINLKNYAQRFALCGKPIVKVGINFDSTQGNIEDWIIEEE